MAESFFATIKRESSHTCLWPTLWDFDGAASSTSRAGAHLRLHSTLGNVPPLEWELRYAHRDLLAA